MRFSRLLTGLCLLALGAVGLPFAAQAAPAPNEKIEPRLAAALAGEPPGAVLGVVVRLKDQLDLAHRSSLPADPHRQEALIRALQDHARRRQSPLRAWLKGWQAQGQAGPETAFWLFNGLALQASSEMIQRLAARPEVQSVTLDAIEIQPAGGLQAPTAAAENLAAIHAPELWALGYAGQGVVIASLDTGVSLNGPGLAARWRGGGNSWYDPYGRFSQPADLAGHGTQVMGVMVGGLAGDTAIGVAPQAQWIAARIFDDQGRATASAIHLAYQWLLDPDGDPTTPDAPQVVNNSWDFSAPGCNLEFQLDLKALRAAGILPVFAAGNYGPQPGTSPSPANYREAFSVGGIDRNDLIDPGSSRGPAQCGEMLETFPSLVAPGLDILTTDLGGFYTVGSGTSLAAPHAAAGLALLLSAFPGLSAEQQEHALVESAVDLGAYGSDQTYGFGRLDLLAAYQHLLEYHQPPTPAPVPTLLFESGFESGMQGWAGQADGAGRLAVAAQAALRGAAGLQARLDQPGSLYVQDDTPAAEARYRARFYFAPNGVWMGPRQAHDLFVGLDGRGTTLLRVQLRAAAVGDGYEIRVVAPLPGGPSQGTAWVPLSNAVHNLEIYWQAAASPRAGDGELGLWLDGRPAAALHGLSSRGRLESVRLGPQNVGPGILGVEYFDAFVSARSGYLGP